MTHCPTEDILLDYIAGTLNAANAAQFEQHADQCAPCSELRKAQAVVWQRMDEWKPTPVSEGFNRELWRRIDADTEAQRSSWQGRLSGLFQFSLWKRVAPLAVVLAVVGTAYVFDHSSHSDSAVPVTKAAMVVSLSDADQLERALDDIQLLDAADTASVAVKPGSGLM